MVEISNLGLGIIFAGTFIFTFLTIGGWRIWRKYLAPAEALCGRWHTIRVNMFWIVVTLINWTIIGYLLIRYNPEEWAQIKEAMSVG